ncbi:transporter substrate-binding domain-containing protein [Psychrobacter pacificensis]|uniref:substrate-binding periplasmic protein n=1 Tax=Psychrobacter pacificensis TaxID=112002 RepID=UPI001CBBD513|nr:transporter substrate-binding domain-containing protein [Psychrobacter pacificensis]MBZ1393115.1 transporter substrate-binding domain-containing protein [Psychrobacter pacificensis]
MKQLYRILPVVLSVGVFGCSNSSTPESTAAENPPAEGQEEFVSSLPDSAPVLKVATTGTMPPFSFQDDYGNMQGIDIDSIRALGEEEGFKVEFYKETWQNMFDTVESGSRDLAISGISYKDERDAKYGLSQPYFFNPAAIMYAKPELNINSLDDLQGKNISAMEGSKQVDQAQQMGKYNNFSTRTTAFLLYEDLMQGKVDAILHDLPILQYTAKNHPEQKVTIVPYEGQDNPSAQQVILMAKGNTELINKINDGITKLKAEGKFKEIEARWLGETTSPTASASATTEQAN